jgi:hypothetical protein
VGFLLTSLSVGTLIAERYCGVGALEKFWQSIRRKIPRLLCQGVKIFHVKPNSVDIIATFKLSRPVICIYLAGRPFATDSEVKQNAMPSQVARYRFHLKLDTHFGVKMGRIIKCQ